MGKLKIKTPVKEGVYTLSARFNSKGECTGGHVFLAAKFLEGFGDKVTVRRQANSILIFPVKEKKK